MITLYGFGRIFVEGRGETKDLWAQWALEELGLPYRVHALDHTDGELDGQAYGRISAFHQAPAIDDDGFMLSESTAIVLYLAEKAGRLIPGDARGRARVTQWCCAAVATIYPTFLLHDFVEMFDGDQAAPTLHAEIRKLIGRWLGDVERRLENRTWIACEDFTVADIMLAGTLRMIRKTDLMEPFPRLKSYYGRCLARPAWQRTLALSAERIGMSVDDIR